jgi:hypothetical protein
MARPCWEFASGRAKIRRKPQKNHPNQFMIKSLPLTLAASILATGVGMSAVVVTPVSVTSTIAGDAKSKVDYLLVDNSKYSMASLQRPVGTAVTLPSGATVSDALATYHARAGTGHRESWTKSVNDGNPVFTFDLGADTDIGSVILWQYGNNGGNGPGNEGNSTREFSLMFKTEAEGNDFSTWTPEFSGTMDSIPGDTTADNYAQLFPFTTLENVRYVGLRIDSNYAGQPGITGGGDRYGLGEVRFVDEVVPEPSATTLVGALCLLGLLRRRR